jgi:DNA replication protein DnaC
MTVTTPAAPPLPGELDALLRRLRMPYVRKAAPDVIATATAQRWEPAEVLRVLLAEEAAGRDRATIAMRRRQSGLPAGKTFDAWDEDASPIPTATQRALRTLEWIERAEALCVCGPSGTGKSHLVEALGHLAIDRGKTVARHTLESLAVMLRRHRADDTTGRAIARLIRSDLIVIDDIGMLPVAADAAEALFRVVDAAYEKRSIALTSNIHPAGFDELMPKTLATATVDRLLHHAHVLITDGTDSYRLDRRQGGDAPGLTRAARYRRSAARPTASRPRVDSALGRSDGHQWGEKMAAAGEIRWPPLGRNRWPLTAGKALRSEASIDGSSVIAWRRSAGTCGKRLACQFRSGSRRRYAGRLALWLASRRPSARQVLLAEARTRSETSSRVGCGVTAGWVDPPRGR